ncbi:MAG: GNAT family N-acetyltransferase [Scytonema sp. RU_4_4]|nr:GNAT family N-acetyltransferase [Scytonema sp. RU_4_4]
MLFLPENFEIPEILKTDYFFLRSITLHDVVKDYDAVMSSREHLWQRFGKIWGWPPEDLTLEQDLIDLAWHQKEFQLRRSFDYAVMSLDETRLLGCVYIDPANSEEYDAEVYYWVRSSELASGLEDYLGDIVQNWIATSWPFKRVEYPGRGV